jgi:hypothetical protein
MSSADRNALRLTIFIGDTDLWQDRAFLPQLDP